MASVPGDLVFHAGAVSDGRTAVLLPAASNHGKSTLTAALVRDGLQYLTDEAAAVTALYVLVVEVFIRREVKWTELVEVVRESTMLVGAILIHRDFFESLPIGLFDTQFLKIQPLPDRCSQ